MTSNPNLVPTRIVDKNGKRTTVRKKTQSEAASKQTVPAPSITTVESEHRKLVTNILNMLDSVGAANNRDAWTETRRYIVARLEATTDIETLRVTHELIRLTGEECGTEYDDSQITTSLAAGDYDSIRLMHAHREWCWQYTGMDTILISTARALKRKLGLKQEADGSMRTIEAHLQATIHYSGSRLRRNQHNQIPGYRDNVEYMRMVETHAAHITTLLQYRKERGMEQPAQGPLPLDEQDFAEYRQHHNVKDGWL